MKYKGVLTEAILVRRYFRFLVDVLLKNKRRRTLYCPNLDPLPFCETPGNRVWYSTANRLTQGYLECLELVEVGGRGLCCINPEYAKALIIEGIHQGIITECAGLRFLHNRASQHSIELLIKENQEQCFIHVEPVIHADERGDGYTMESTLNIKALQELILQKSLGNRAILFYCVQNMGVSRVKPFSVRNPGYLKVLKTAIELGVEVLGYRANINPSMIVLDSKIPLILSEDLTYR